ncbi:heme-binding beta-barrel domain-containing protein [Psychromonas sp. CD1]|uniref:heme-binding beta-barrel domain-containing protein n=1 Tax=Psychromonas sp. CD1 TaxID=1979839 RepID=UPI000B9B3C04|nr:heme-binding beta-barrel domain-containing protein [Psychromonas sp. CD1]
MSKDGSVNYGPLAGLIGDWHGEKGTDIAPEPDGTETNLYYENITFSEAGEVCNAEEQCLSAVHYIQQVCRISNNKVIHRETGYWMWGTKDNSVMHSLTIPRGMCVLAGGNVIKNQENMLVFDVQACIEKGDWQLIQSPFMLKKAKMTHYAQQLTLNGDTLSYKQTMLLDIYGKIFEHTDGSTLLRK